MSTVGSDTTTPPETGAQTANDLRRASCDASDRIAQLETERCALEEACDNLGVHERDLAQRLEAARNRPIEQAAETANADHIYVEIAGTKQEIMALERRCKANVQRTEELARDAETLSSELVELQGDASAAETTLQTVEDSIRRMDRKLGFAERKHATAVTDLSGGRGADD